MAQPRIAHRYAKSLMDLSRERESIDFAFADMELVLKACTESRELFRMLKSPVINTDKKIAIFKEIFSNKIASLSLDFFILIAKKRREKYIPEIAAAFVSQYKEEKGIKIAEVSSSIKLTEEMKNKIVELVAGKTKYIVELVEKINPSLIGGFILRVGDNQIDQSISTQIALLKRDFAKN